MENRKKKGSKSIWDFKEQKSPDSTGNRTFMLATFSAVFSSIFEPFFENAYKDYWDSVPPELKDFIINQIPEGLNALSEYFANRLIGELDFFAKKHFNEMGSNDWPADYSMTIIELFQSKYGLPGSTIDEGELVQRIEEHYSNLPSQFRNASAQSHLFKMVNKISTAGPKIDWIDIFDFCIFWDRCPIPGRFWTTKAAAEHFIYNFKGNWQINTAQHRIKDIKSRYLKSLPKSKSCLVNGHKCKYAKKSRNSYSFLELLEPFTPPVNPSLLNFSKFFYTTQNSCYKLLVNNFLNKE